jgi:hypothetical protein
LRDEQTFSRQCVTAASDAEQTFQVTSCIFRLNVSGRGRVGLFRGLGGAHRRIQAHMTSGGC